MWQILKATLSKKYFFTRFKLCTFLLVKNLSLFLLIPSITLTGCLSTQYKIPETKEDYAYYGLEYTDAINAIKYCKNNQDTVNEIVVNGPYLTTDGKTEVMLRKYKELRSKVSPYMLESQKKYPIPVEPTIIEQVISPFAIITFPLWIWFAGDSKKFENSYSTIGEYLSSCDAIYLTKLEKIDTELDRNDSIRKYCTYSFPHTGMPITECRPYAEKYSKLVTLDAKYLNILDDERASLQEQIKNLKHNSETIYDYREQIDRLQYSLRYIDFEEMLLRYLKYIHPKNFIEIRCTNDFSRLFVDSNISLENTLYNDELVMKFAGIQGKDGRYIVQPRGKYVHKSLTMLGKVCHVGGYAEERLGN